MAVYNTKWKNPSNICVTDKDRKKNKHTYLGIHIRTHVHTHMYMYVSIHMYTINTKNIKFIQYCVQNVALGFV